MCPTEMFCKYDDFCKDFEIQWNRYLLLSGANSGKRPGILSLSGRLTIFTLFHQSDYRTFKHFYNREAEKNLRHYFPKLISCERFVALMPSMLTAYTVFIYTLRGECTGISYVDSTKITVCKNIRIPGNKVFKGAAKRGKSSTGWFYGFKLHLIINDKGEILAFHISAGNVDDRKPVTCMTGELFGKLFGDRGYVSGKLFGELMKKGVQLITTMKKNMKNKLIPLMDKILLRKRYITETVNDQLKNISQIEHSRHRSFTNCMVNILAGIAAYCFKEKKPSIRMDKKLIQEIIC